MLLWSTGRILISLGHCRLSAHCLQRASDTVVIIAPTVPSSAPHITRDFWGQHSRHKSEIQGCGRTEKNRAAGAQEQMTGYKINVWIELKIDRDVCKHDFRCHLYENQLVCRSSDQLLVLVCCSATSMVSITISSHCQSHHASEG